MSMHMALFGIWAEDAPTTASFLSGRCLTCLLPYHRGMPHSDLRGTALMILRRRPVPA